MMQFEVSNSEQDPIARRESFEARILAATEWLARVEHDLQHERKRETDLAFAAQKQANELRSAITGMRQALAVHHEFVMQVGHIIAECSSILKRRRAAGEHARSVEKDRVSCILYAENILAREYKLGLISAYSRVGKIINAVRFEMDRREDRARSSQPKRHDLPFASETVLPTMMHYSDHILSTLGNRASCRRLGFVSRALTRRILGIAEWMLPRQSDEPEEKRVLAWRLFPLLESLVSIRGILYERTLIDRNLRERLLHAGKDDQRISRILGSPISAAENCASSGHDILKWNDVVSGLPEDLLRLWELREEWRYQSQVTLSVEAGHEQAAVTLQDAMIEYEKTFHMPWRPPTRGPVAADIPAIARPHLPKKQRNAQEYAGKQKPRQPAMDGQDSGYFTIRETEQWRSDLRELPEDLRRAFCDTAEHISRQEARKPIGSSRGRTFYSIPLGDFGRIVFSIDAGIAILERAFGMASRVEDYRKYRKDIQKGRI